MVRQITLVVLMGCTSGCAAEGPAAAPDSLVVKFDQGPPPADLTCDRRPDFLGPPQLQGTCPATVAPVFMDATLVGYVSAPAPNTAWSNTCPYWGAKFVQYAPILVLKPLEVTVSVKKTWGHPLLEGAEVSIGMTLDCEAPIIGQCVKSEMTSETSLSWDLWPGTYHLVVGSNTEDFPVTVSIRLRAR
jgi:hypothetical protein